MPSLEDFYAFVDKSQDFYVQKLAETIAIPSVSGTVKNRPDVVRMGQWLEAELKRLGATVQMKNVGKQVLEGQEIDLPPVVLAQYGNDPSKKTVCVYGHYDVQPALKSDGWATDPFTLVEDDQGRMFGRGSTDDKGPVISWLWVIDIHQKLGLELPVNLKMCFEGMEESGSEGLDALIYAEADKFFKGTDCVCISDNYWLGTTKPCLTYGLRGVSYFHLTIEGPGRDLHSGVFGGTVHEPMTDLVHVMSKLVSPDGKILVTGLMESVAPVSQAEKQIYENLDFDMSDIYNAIDSKNVIHDSKEKALMARWRFPSLSLHGIEGAFYSQGAKTVIPAKVIGKFSIRTVPDMDPKQITQLVYKFVTEEFNKLGSKNKMSISCDHEGKWWVADVNSWNFVAASKATVKVHGVKPDLTREGGSIPVTLTFQEALKKSVLLLPMGRSDDGAHSINEKLDRSNYVKGIKLLGTYLHEVASIEIPK
jgi:Cys-Gly metallodipeptidase DUG1